MERIYGSHSHNFKTRYRRLISTLFDCVGDQMTTFGFVFRGALWPDFVLINIERNYHDCITDLFHKFIANIRSCITLENDMSESMTS